MAKATTTIPTFNIENLLHQLPRSVQLSGAIHIPLPVLEVNAQRIIEYVKLVVMAQPIDHSQNPWELAVVDIA